MRAMVVQVAAMGLMLVGMSNARAGLLVGPDFSLSSPFTAVGGNDASWGIQFMALQGSTLTGFDYVHRTANFGNAFTGTVSLIDVSNGNTVLYSTAYGALPANGNPALSVLSVTGLSIPLTSGDVYRLVAQSTTMFSTNDEVFQYSTGSTFTFPVSNADISVTQGVFSNNPGFQENFAWGAFRNLATEPLALPVPEPASLAVLGVGILGAVGLARRRAARLSG